MEHLALLSCQKNEGPFLVDFVAHHIAAGFKDIFLVTNPSDDGTSELAEALSELGYIKHLHTDTPKGHKPQEYAYAEARRAFGIDGFEWLLVLDADELINVHVGALTVQDLLSQFSNSIDLVSINMACYGCHPHTHWTPENDSSRFLFRLQSTHWRNSPAKSFIHHPRNFETLRPHGPIGFKLDRAVEVAFHAGLKFSQLQADSAYYFSTVRSPGSFDSVHQIAQVNHYVVRTRDSFSLRAIRGRGDHPDPLINSRHTPEYFSGFGMARFHDASISSYADKTKEVKAILLSDKNVLECHLNSFTRYRQKIGALNGLTGSVVQIP